MQLKLDFKDLGFALIASRGGTKYLKEGIVAVIAVKWRSISIFGK